MQDVLVVHAISVSPPTMLYMVCDGHAGREAAQFVSQHFLNTLLPLLPHKQPDFNKAKGMCTLRS